MIPAIRNILGGFLFSGDDVYKKAAVLSGGERTRLAVARMLLHPSNTMLLDEPTNHLDIDSKEVLLDALIDYGGTLIFVSHDRYFVDRLATKIIDVGRAARHPIPADMRRSSGARRSWPAPPMAARRWPGRPGRRPRRAGRRAPDQSRKGSEPGAGQGHRPRIRGQEARRCGAAKAATSRASCSQVPRQPSSKARIGETERAIKDAGGPHGRPVVLHARRWRQAALDEHQSLMWKVGELLGQWEMLTTELEQNRQ